MHGVEGTEGSKHAADEHPVVLRSTVGTAKGKYVL